MHTIFLLMHFIGTYQTCRTGGGVLVIFFFLTFQFSALLSLSPQLIQPPAAPNVSHPATISSSSAPLSSLTAQILLLLLQYTCDTHTCSRLCRHRRRVGFVGFFSLRRSDRHCSLVHW